MLLPEMFTLPPTSWTVALMSVDGSDAWHSWALYTDVEVGSVDMLAELQNAWAERSTSPLTWRALAFRSAAMEPACVYWVLVTLVSCIVVTSSELPPAT